MPMPIIMLTTVLSLMYRCVYRSRRNASQVAVLNKSFVGDAVLDLRRKDVADQNEAELVSLNVVVAAVAAENAVLVLVWVKNVVAVAKLLEKQPAVVVERARRDQKDVNPAQAEGGAAAVLVRLVVAASQGDVANVLEAESAR